MRTIISTFIVLFVFVSSAHADLICSRVVNNRGKLSIQSKTVTTANCPKGYSKVADTSSLTGPAGATGATGETGPAGQTGPVGGPGVGFGGPVSSGITLTGFFGERRAPAALNQNHSEGLSFGARIPTDISDSQVVVKATQPVIDVCGSFCIATNDRDNQQFCTGTAENPTAASGYVCIYPFVLANVSGNLQGLQLFNSRYGFQVFWTSSTLETSFLGGTWAYTAP